jgi:hypothetical protein
VIRTRTECRGTLSLQKIAKNKVERGEHGELCIERRLGCAFNERLLCR